MAVSVADKYNPLLCGAQILRVKIALAVENFGMINDDFFSGGNGKRKLDISGHVLTEVENGLALRRMNDLCRF